jgi:hypothetical protein
VPSYGREGTPVLNERDDFTCGGLGSAVNAPRVALQEPGVRLDPLRAIARSIHVHARVQSCEGVRGSIGKDSGGYARRGCSCGRVCSVTIISQLVVRQWDKASLVALGLLGF